MYTLNNITFYFIFYFNVYDKFLVLTLDCIMVSICSKTYSLSMVSCSCQFSLLILFIFNHYSNNSLNGKTKNRRQPSL